MNNRLKAFAVTLLIIILMANFVNAVQVTDITEGLENNSAEITSLKADLSTKLIEINKKLDKTMEKQEMTDLLTAHLIKTQEIMDAFRSILIVMFIIIGLCLLGLGYSVYFYFKSKGRL